MKARQLSFVAGFDQLMDQCGGGSEAEEVRVGRNDETRPWSGRVIFIIPISALTRVRGRSRGARTSPRWTLRGDGPEAMERHREIAEQRRQREELPALQLDGAGAAQALEQQAQAEVSRIERRRDAQVSILDKLIERARELAAEVKERVTTVARDVAERVESFFGTGKREFQAEAALDNTVQETGAGAEEGRLWI